jgi:hypothetical protein
MVGLWRAHRWVGPAARGPLIIRQVGGGYTADMVGRRVPVRVENGELCFDLPAGQGAFRGKVEARRVIRGHWFPPPSNAQFTGATYASPVHLRRDGATRWRGDVVPFEDRFTFYLMVRKRPRCCGIRIATTGRKSASSIWRSKATSSSSWGRVAGKRRNVSWRAAGTMRSPMSSRWRFRIAAAATISGATRRQRLLPARQETRPIRLRSSTRP